LAAESTPPSPTTDDVSPGSGGGSIKILINGVRKIYYAPVPTPPEDNAPPAKRPVLEWVFGYRGADAARNLWVLEKGGELVYYVGAVVVVYHRMDETQRHYTGHTEDIQCLDIHPQVFKEDISNI
jgi:microtubule-associated protein-like 1/2